MSDNTIALSNGILDVAVALHGAEMRSILETSTGGQYLWQADKNVWGRSAPILFPVVGRLKGDRYILENTTYKMPQHGFARDSLFTLIERQPTLALLELAASSATRQIYPFDFSLRVKYELQSNTVVISYTVSNEGNTEMFFSIGSHPAFNIPFGAGTYTDYFVEFDHEEAVGFHYLKEGLQAGELPSLLKGNRILQLTDTLFDNDAILLKGFQSKRIYLKNHLDQTCIEVATGGAPYLGIWSKPHSAPFVCIEPWFGIADRLDGDGNLKHKEGIQALEPRQTFETSYSITIS